MFCTMSGLVVAIVETKQWLFLHLNLPDFFLVYSRELLSLIVYWSASVRWRFLPFTVPKNHLEIPLTCRFTGPASREFNSGLMDWAGEINSSSNYVCWTLLKTWGKCKWTSGQKSTHSLSAVVAGLQVTWRLRVTHSPLRTGVTAQVN